MRKHRINELKYRPVEFTESQQTEDNLKGKKQNKTNKQKNKTKKNRALGICGTITKYLAFVSSESQKDRRKSGTEKSLKKIMLEKFSNLTEGINLQTEEAE